MTPDVLSPGPVELHRGLPRWFQIAEHLRAVVAGAAGAERLPTEDALAAHYGVSVATVRQALGALVEEGLVVRRRRSGTFVNPAPPAVRPLVLRGAVDAVIAQQAAEEVELLERVDVAVPAELAGSFPGHDTVVRFRRLRTDGGVPTSVADNWVLPEIAAHVRDDDLRAGPMTRALRDRAGVAISRIENVVEARHAGPELAGLLGVDLVSPVLVCRAWSHDAEGRVVDAAAIHYRGDRFRYAVTVRADD